MNCQEQERDEMVLGFLYYGAFKSFRGLGAVWRIGVRRLHVAHITCYIWWIQFEIFLN